MVNKFKEEFFLSNKDDTRREVLAAKFPEMEQHFQELKKQAYEPIVGKLLIFIYLLKHVNHNVNSCSLNQILFPCN